MTSGSLTDLDPPPARERRWPFYIAWTVGGVVVGAVLFNHLPAGLVPARIPVAAPAMTDAPLPTAAPAAPRVVPQPIATFRVDGPAGPARPAIGPLGPVLVVPARP
jgi:hypothetical protein